MTDTLTPTRTSPISTSPTQTSPAQTRPDQTSPAPSRITSVAAAPADVVIAHVDRRLSLETDASDVMDHLQIGAAGVVVVDTRSRELYEAGHVPTAISLPLDAIDEATTAHLDRDTIYVTYCTGPQCNGSTKAARRFAELGFPVKELIGGWWGWRANRFPATTGTEPGSL